MEKLYYPHADECVYRTILPNGLTVLVVPRPGFQKKLCYLAVDYGSIHRKCVADGENFEAPMGIAHYLEHKLFDMPGRDVSAEFAALGGFPNAFTGYDMTAYHFSCTDHFEQCLKLLLEFVTTPYFTEETVEKERGIIQQEILMNQDSPDTVIFEQQAAAMYKNHPVREPILGTEESVGEITPELLTKCHQAFYHPGNMLLCVAGDVDPEQVAKIAQEQLPAVEAPKVQVQRSWPEAMTVDTPLVRCSMEVAMPTFQLSFKSEDPGWGRESVELELMGELAAEMLFGESSPLYMRLYEEGVIDSSFGGGFDTMEGLSMLTAGGDSEDPEKVRQAILDYAAVLVEQGIPEEDFLRMKRSAVGRRIRSMDSFDSLCFRLCAYHFSGFDFFELPGLYEHIRLQAVLELIRRTVTPERCSLSIIDPL